MERFYLAAADIRSLSAAHAQRNEKEILLEGNVTLLRTDGAVYEAEKVHYDQRKKLLRGVGPFYAHREEDYVRGYDFLYDVTPKITRARKVFAHYRLKEGGRELRRAGPKE
jgi:lipopolysaccharide assembly outer membrane protein LptD (OstA)